MLVMQHRCAVDVLNHLVFGIMLNCLKHECCKFEILYGQDENLVPSVQSLHAHLYARYMDHSADTVVSFSDRLAVIHGESISWSSSNGHHH